MNKGKCFKTIIFAIAMLMVFYLGDVSTEAATTAQKSAFAAELEQMLYSVDTTTHYVYDYKLTVSEFNTLYENMKNGDCRLIIASYYSNMRVTYTTKWFWIDTIQITNVDSDVLPRYERLKKNVEEIQAGIEAGMSDLDKVIYLHDALVDLVDYRYVAYQSYGACGALGDEEAVCAGYTKAYNMLLNMNGIEAYYAEGNGINHGWTYVNLDGAWYHVDTTWDDTRSAIKGVPSHQFLLRNDKEFAASGTNSHVAWVLDDVSEKSTSTRFSNWYVHDITGKMSFEDGLWYYVDSNNNIVSADALGNKSSVVLSGANLAKLTMVDVEDGTITYKIGGSAVQESLANVGNSNVEAPKEEITEPEDSTETDTGITVEGELSAVSTYDFNDINNWQTGKYSTVNGALADGAGYICTKELVTCKGLTTLNVVMKDTRFHGVVNEYTAEGTFIQATDVVNGDELITSVDCAYIGVSIYFPGWKTITFEEYAKKFTYDLMTFELVVLREEIVEDVVDEETVTETENEFVDIVVIENMGTVDTVNFNDINTWKMGGYDVATGEFAQLAGYICTQKLVRVNATCQYLIAMKDARFHTVINEYASDGRFLGSKDLVDGNTWVPNAQTTYIGVSIYYPMWKGITFEEYKKKFTYNLMSLDINKQ